MQHDVLKGISFSSAKMLTSHELVQVARQLESMTAFHVLQLSFGFPPIRLNVLSMSAPYWIHKYYRVVNGGMSGNTWQTCHLLVCRPLVGMYYCSIGNMGLNNGQQCGSITLGDNFHISKGWLV